MASPTVAADISTSSSLLVSFRKGVGILTFVDIVLYGFQRNETLDLSQLLSSASNSLRLGRIS